MDWIKKLESYLHERGKVDKTIESYTGDIRGYFSYIADRGITFDGKLNRFSINSYKKYLHQNNYEPSTINKKLNSLQSFNQYLVETDMMAEMVIHLGRDRIKIAKGSEKQVEVYSDAVVDALLFHLETKPKQLRDKVMVQLLLYTGARITKEAKLPQKLKPHTFRHHFCTTLINKGVPLTTVAKLAGHASIETTSRFYIGCSRQEKMDAVNLL